jgi:restriction endonuclease Mrr
MGSSAQRHRHSKRQPPEEHVDGASKEIEEDLRAELLDRVLKMSPTFFEKVVVDLLLAMGYGGAGADSGRRIGRTGDGGVDGVINEDALGLDIVYIQAKRYAPGNVVGVDKVREFSGAMEERGAMKGVFDEPLCTGSSCVRGACSQAPHPRRWQGTVPAARTLQRRGARGSYGRVEEGRPGLLRGGGGVVPGARRYPLTAAALL